MLRTSSDTVLPEERERAYRHCPCARRVPAMETAASPDGQRGRRVATRLRDRLAKIQPPGLTRERFSGSVSPGAVTHWTTTQKPVSSAREESAAAREMERFACFCTAAYVVACAMTS